LSSTLGKLRSKPVDAIKLSGPDHAIRDKVPFIVAYVGNTLSFFKPGLAFF